MKNVWQIFIALSCCLLSVGTIQAAPADDVEVFRAYFQERFPDLSLEDLSNGMYNFDQDKREQWQEIMEFPPYELAVEEGEQLFTTPFKNGKTYADCLENGGMAIAHTYPRFDTKSGKVKTLAAELNECRVKNGEKPLPYLKGKLVLILA